MEILVSLEQSRPPLAAALFDFDGTISTLRCGWETVMAPLMLEVLSVGRQDEAELEREVGEYIDTSAGIQTIFQMQWLADRVRALGREPSSPWEYKAEYNRRLMRIVELRRAAVEEGREDAERFMVGGCRGFLTALRDRGIGLYVASGTDRHDVAREAEILGVAGYFREISGAPPGEASCPKERVMQELLEQQRLSGEELVVVGDGKVEISIARKAGALALGIASDEIERTGVNPVKRARLIGAGAHAIAGDFTDTAALLAWLGLG